MKISFKAEDLKKVVSRCVRYTNPKGFLSEFGYLCFSGATITATNGIVGIIQTTRVGFGDEKLLLPAEIFHRAITELGNQEVELTIDVGVTLKSGGFRTRFEKVIWNEAETEFPRELPQEGLTKTPKDFMMNIKQVRFSVSGDENKPGMMGVYFDGNHFYSTDNYRITRIQSNEPADENAKPDALLIPDSLLALIVGEGEPNGFCIENVNDKQRIWFFYDDFIVFGNLLKGEFPNCKPVFEAINVDSLEKIEFDRANMIKILERLSILNIESPYRTDVLIHSGKLFLLVNGEGAYAVEKQSVETKAEGLFSISLNFLKEAINATERFYFDPNRKAPIYFQSQSGLETLLLPLEVGDVETDSILARVGEQVEKPTEPAETEPAEATAETEKEEC